MMKNSGQNFQDSKLVDINVSLDLIKVSSQKMDDITKTTYEGRT